MNRLIILAGPSCVGKTPLLRALRRHHPALAEPLAPVVLYNSRAPRPEERDGVDYHFRPREQIAEWADRDGFTVREVRGDLQGLDHDELARGLAGGSMIYEGNPVFGSVLLSAELPVGVERVSAFVSPVGAEELAARARSGADPREAVTEMMRRKLLRRTRANRGELSDDDRAEIERRAASAYNELAEAHRYDWVLVNHDGEDSDHWEAFGYPLGDARRTTTAAAELLAGGDPAGAERWSPATPPRC